MTKLGRPIATALLLAANSNGNAHSPVEGAANFYWGIIHPYYQLAAALIVVAFGLIAGRMPQGRSTTKIMTAYMAAISLTLIIILFHPLTLHVYVALGMAIILGLMVVSDRRPPLSALIAVAMLTAATAAATSPPDGNNLREQLLMTAGSFIGLTLPPLYLIMLLRQLNKPWPIIGVRIIGSWITACGILVLCLQFSEVRS